MELSLLAGANLPLNFWGEAFSIAVTIINVLPTVVLNYDSPYQLLFHKEPDYKFFKTFGCACYPLLRPYNFKKFDFKSSLCIFLGYNNIHKGYKCLALNGKVYMTRHVLFNETLFPYNIQQNPFITPLDQFNQSFSNTQTLTILQPALNTDDSHNTVNVNKKNFVPSAPSVSSVISSTPISSADTNNESRHQNEHHMLTRSKAGIFKPHIFNASTDLSIPVSVK